MLCGLTWKSNAPNTINIQFRTNITTGNNYNSNKLRRVFLWGKKYFYTRRKLKRICCSCFCSNCYQEASPCSDLSIQDYVYPTLITCKMPPVELFSTQIHILRSSSPSLMQPLPVSVHLSEVRVSLVPSLIPGEDDTQGGLMCSLKVDT